MTSYYEIPQGASNQYPESPSITAQAVRVAVHHIQPVISGTVQQCRARLHGRWNLRSFLTLGKFLTVLWFLLLYWGERSIFRNSVDSCEWSNWENWASDASPHRLIFIADPQLVDPHTYPGRPWPLSTLTVRHTDIYLRRSYSRIQKVLYPDTIFFLGDLFDGGREWSTRSTTSPEAQWRKYGDSFWLREYDRFGRIFFNHWGDGGMTPRPGQPGRKIISSLPGNHDLGFGTGIQASVRKRFNAYFGDGNRIDVIGNHTFVSVDTVSLSALGQPQSDEEIWRPTMEFLDNAQTQKKRAVMRELRVQQGLTPNLPFKHALIDTKDLAKAELPHYEETDAEFPTILLTHVPLYRSKGTPCGPLREHWPPSTPPKGQIEPVDPDERNAIAVRGGYQYQNVLTKEISKDITEKIGNIEYAFSGDDHDYCEVVHRGYPSAGAGIREITVKSISWAMGVHKPGIVMLSLWNPVDNHGNQIPTKESTRFPTVQTHLCLLPDQLGIFIRYALLFGWTITLLTIRAVLVAFGSLKSSLTDAESPVLPVSELASSTETEKAELYSRRPSSPDGISSKSSTSSDRGKLAIRNSNARTRSVSPSGSYGLSAAQSKYNYPLIQHAGYFPPARGAREVEQWDTVNTSSKKKPKKLKGCGLFFAELKRSIIQVASVVLIWYFWLTWNG